MDRERVESALTRILEHAEQHGEVYPGARDDIATVKAAAGIGAGIEPAEYEELERADDIGSDPPA